MLYRAVRRSTSDRAGSTSDKVCEQLTPFRRGGVLEVCTSHFSAAISGLESISIIPGIHTPQSNGTSLTSTSLYTSSASASLGCTRTVWTTSTSTAARGDKRFFSVYFGITLHHITRATLSRGTVQSVLVFQIGKRPWLAPSLGKCMSAPSVCFCLEIRYSRLSGSARMRG